MRKLTLLLAGAMTLGTIIVSTFVFGQSGHVAQPVPVAQPAKVIEKDGKPDSKPDSKESSTPDNTLLPGKFVKNRLETLQNAGYVSVHAMKVDSSRRCWLDPNYPYNKKTDKTPILITKDEAGFHVVLEDISHQWEAGEFDTAGWLLVKSVKVASPGKTE